MGRHLQLVQRAIETIVPVWREFDADADSDSVPSTVTSPTYIEDVGVAYELSIVYSIVHCQMRMKCGTNGIL